MDGPQLIHKGGGGVLGLLKPELLRLHLLGNALHTLARFALRLVDQGGTLLLRLPDQIIRPALGDHKGLPHGVLGGPVLLHLVGQHLHLAFQHGVLAVQGGVIRRQNIQKFVHLGHIVAVEGGLLKGALRHFLGRKHSVIPPKIFLLPKGKRADGYAGPSNLRRLPRRPIRDGAWAAISEI